MGTRLHRRVIYWNHPGPIVPVCGAYAIRPYTSGRLYRIISPTAPTPSVLVFLSVRVGAYYIRPIGRPRQGDECGFWVVSLGD